MSRRKGHLGEENLCQQTVQPRARKSSQPRPHHPGNVVPLSLRVRISEGRARISMISMK